MKNEAQCRMIALWKYLYHQTDETHTVSVQDILKHWSSLEVNTWSRPLDALCASGVLPWELP